MTPRFSWVLNLDAELEMAGRPVGKQTRARVREQARVLLGDLVAEADAVVAPEPCGETPNSLGIAWCTTPRAIRALVDAGFVAPSLDPEVVRKVNHRGFVRGWGESLEQHFCFDGAAARRVVASTSALGLGWRVKRCHSFAGRDQRVVASTSEELPWLVSWADHGGVVIEAQADIVEEMSMHAFVGHELLTGRLVSTSDGEPDYGADSSLAVQTQNAMHGVAARLRGAGYIGPVGIDGFVYRFGGATEVRALSEINARFTMNYAFGMRGTSWREACVASGVAVERAF